MRLLDLFCGAGGAAMGYHRAGFDQIVGVDIVPQPNYPFTFIQGNALQPPVRLKNFDLIHASPPCQAHTALRVMPNARIHADLIPATRTLLEGSGIPYVIENVEGAPLHNPIRLCGTGFGLGVEAYDGWRQLRRHRLFELSFTAMAIPCAHDGPTIGLYGDHLRDRRRREKDGIAGKDFSRRDKMPLGRLALDMPWATQWRELTEAIPPRLHRIFGPSVPSPTDSRLVDILVVFAFGFFTGICAVLSWRTPR